MSPVVRAIGVIGAVAVLVTSITYAALQSQATLTDNTIDSATANLDVATSDGSTCGTFGDTAAGVGFTGVVPGGSDSDDEYFCLKNSGADTSLDLSVMSEAVTWPVTDDLGSGVDNGEVTLNISCDNGGTLSATIASLEAGDEAFTGGTLAPSAETLCTAYVSMTSAAFSGSSASSDMFDLTFTGTGV